MSTKEEKKQYRTEALLRRQFSYDRDQAQGGTAKEALRDAFLARFDFSTDKVISGYIMHGTEIDPSCLLEALRKKGHPIALPTIIAQSSPLIFRQWGEGVPLKKGIWGIPEPPETEPIIKPDILIVPLLAYDSSLHRLGYGGGYYDRTLALLRAEKESVAIGVAFADQEVPHLPHGEHDQLLDAVIGI